jgi:hypothetical protein
MASELSPEEQQEKWLSEGKAVAKQQAFLMKRALDSGSLRDGLKVGCPLVNWELPLSTPTPPLYPAPPFRLHLLLGRPRYCVLSPR